MPDVDALFQGNPRAGARSPSPAAGGRSRRPSLMSGNRWPERLLVLADQRIRPEEVDVVRDQHQVARPERPADAAGGVGQDHGPHSQPREHARRERRRRPSAGPRRSGRGPTGRRPASCRRVRGRAPPRGRRRPVGPGSSGSRRTGWRRGPARFCREGAEARAEHEARRAEPAARRAAFADRRGRLVEPRRGAPLTSLAELEDQAGDRGRHEGDERAARAAPGIPAARGPTCASERGPPMPPIWIPIEEKFAKPQRANVAMSLPFSESCPTTSFIIEKAKNSLMTVLLAIRLPTIGDVLPSARRGGTRAGRAPSRRPSGAGTPGAPKRPPAQPSKPFEHARSGRRTRSASRRC